VNAFATIQQIVLAAKEKLPREVWEYVTFGAESETTVRRNRFALDSLAFRPRIMRDTSEIDPATELLGARLRIPALLAPIGSISRFDPTGAAAAARAAAAFGTTAVIASHAKNELAGFSDRDHASLIYGLIPSMDLGTVEAEVEAVCSAGFRAISVATQSGWYSRRERDIANQLFGKGQPTRPYASFLAQQREEREAGRPASKEGLGRAVLSWSLLERIVARATVPVMVKGVQTGADAVLAVEHGAAALYLSNNGGRALDHARSAVEILPEVVDAVGGRVPVIVDGGVCRASDILKACALGANAVCVGRLQAWALAAGGEAGVVRMLELLEEEMIVAMGLLGVNQVSELTPDYLERVQPCTPPHPLSAFPIAMEREAAGLASDRNVRPVC